MAKIIPLVRLEGVIAAGGFGPGRGALNLAAIEPALKEAFDVKSAPAVALAINSPGGSAAQSSLIGKRIRQLAEQKKKPVIAFVEDVAASGGYWLACAADEIIIDESSIVGSIGVITASFGLTELIAKIGVERRVYTAGQSKSQLDPFKPEDPEQIARWRERLAAIHQVFIDHVKTRRGQRLKEHPRLFEGEIFVGAEAVSLGLADAIGDLRGTITERFGKNAKIKPFKPAKPGLVSRLFGGAAEAAARAALEEVEARTLWARYGL